MVQPRLEEDAAVFQHETPKFQRVRMFLRRNKKPMLVLAIACAALLSYANNLFIDRDDLDNELALRRILAEEDTRIGVDGGEGSGPTFVYIMGIEGTGHHFIESLLAKSPNMKTMEGLGLCKPAGGGRRARKGRRALSTNTKTGELFHLSSQFFDKRHMSRAIFNPTFNSKASLDTKSRYDAGVALLKSARRKFKAAPGGSDNTNNEPFHVAINANNCGRIDMSSYPNYDGPDRALQNFNLDLFYNMCADAEVQCKHAYIYRDSYDVLKSTTKNRQFNDNAYDSIRLYTSVTQQIHSQMVSYPERNLGCFGFLDAKGSQVQQDWERFGRLFGWQPEAFLATAKAINTKSIAPMTEEMKAQIVPERLAPMMKAFENIDHRVTDFCYSSLSAMENQEDHSEFAPEVQ